MRRVLTGWDRFSLRGFARFWHRWISGCLLGRRGTGCAADVRHCQLQYLSGIADFERRLFPG
jgi:hypothetical protein